ncbi:helix-turn-helix domain-containing protein [Microbacterium soli]|uniref:Helix-turn-helix transcriptional regulator n=1 Tax=Microbacterium soli TaxID=446075 RepID=A0ABP7N8N0_9MICO
MHADQHQPGPRLSLAPTRPATPRNRPHPSAELLREARNPLGSYLRARRARITPEQAGLSRTGVRRVPGLRREEVALLAGISADYYLRLERGRDRNPSAQVLDAIARALRLDEESVVHLHLLAATSGHGGHRRLSVLTPPASTLNLLHALSLPAFVEDRYFGILAANAHATALSPRLAAGRNQLRDLFLDPAEQSLLPEWETITECLVANLRQTAGADIEDPRLLELVTGLQALSPRFRMLWSRHEVRGQRATTLRFAHPRLGELNLHRERLVIDGVEDMTLVMFHPEAGSPEEAALARLAVEEPVAV